MRRVGNDVNKITIIGSAARGFPAAEDYPGARDAWHIKTTT